MSNANNPNYMCRYLEYVVEFEKYVWIWTNAMNSANNKLKEIDSQKKQLNAEYAQQAYHYTAASAMQEAEMNKRRKNAKISFAFILLSLLLLAIDGLAFYATYNYNLIEHLTIIEFGSESDLYYFLAMLAIIFTVSLLYNLRKYSKNKRNLSHMKKVDIVSASQVDLGNRKEQIETYKANSQKVIASVKQQQGEIFSALQEAKKTLEQVYSVNVLPNKYRNMCAAATLLGYLKTGRCNTVQGHGGIYDTYEVDAQRNVIITRLTELRDTALRIEANQQILINEMQSANRLLKNINYNVEQINITTKEIEKNTAISAACNQQTAAAASWIAWQM